MKCPHCNQEHPTDFQFCPRTGKKIELLNKACTNKQCSAYGKYVLPMEAMFCPNCGYVINGSGNELSNNLEELKFEVDGVAFSLKKVKAGCFLMGATSEQVNPSSDEKPVVKAIIDNDYYMGTYLVTQALWLATMNYNPSYFGQRTNGTFDENWERLPVEQVSWRECKSFIAQLNVLLRDKLNGMSFRLPTETEWEFAARGGVKSNHYQYAGGTTADEVAWNGFNSYGQTHVVGQKRANELGLYDMSGNVFEWCENKYYEYGTTHVHESGCRVCRGGCMIANNEECRVSSRTIFYSNEKGSGIGMRLCLSF